MLDIPCPQMDRFAVDLINAHRHRDDLINKAPASHEAIRAAVEVFRIQGLITAHRAQCIFCQSRAEAKQKKKPSVAVGAEDAIQRAG